MQSYKAYILHEYRSQRLEFTNTAFVKYEEEAFDPLVIFAVQRVQE